MKKENWENRKISEQAKKTAKHIGIISEGAIQTLIDEIRQEENKKREFLKKNKKMILHDNPKYQTNRQRLEEILMEEMSEFRTPDPSQCICVKCQGQKWDYVQRVIPKILKYFIRKIKL